MIQWHDERDGIRHRLAEMERCQVDLVARIIRAEKNIGAMMVEVGSLMHRVRTVEETVAANRADQIVEEISVRIRLKDIAKSLEGIALGIQEVRHQLDPKPNR